MRAGLGAGEHWRVNLRGLLPLVAAVVVSLIVTACSSSSTASLGAAARPDRATVDHAASLAFGKASKCGRPDRYGEYVCSEHPATCGVQTGEPIDGSEPNAGCWETICDVELGVVISHGENGTKDFYYCERVVAGCTSLTGGCPNHDRCISGRGQKLAVDYERTAELPEHGGIEFSCPYHDEG